MQKTFKALYLFCGIGGGALGFQQAKEEYKGIEGRFETICGIDAIPEICRDFEYITGSRAVCMDLFSKEQYIDFHEKNPPEEWQEVTPDDIREACRGEYPDVVFTSPPCKGFSGLLPAKSAKTKKYQALNKLTIRGIELVCEAFKDNLPSLILLENVPRITTRGKNLLDEIKKVLRRYGYAFSDGYHDCGEIGGLAQHRKRYLLICRNTKKLQGFVYQPLKLPLQTIGDVLENVPLPDAKEAGEMHTLPRLQWKTWLRLALINAGGDWRDLEKIDYTKLRVEHQLIDNISTKFKGNTHTNIYRVYPWQEICGTVVGAYRPNNGALSVADPRIKCRPRSGTYGVMEWNKPSYTITSADVHSGCAAVQDIRIPKETETGKFIIISVDGTWHRPLTTLELAILQGLPMYIDGAPLKLAGRSDKEWRERIGNMVPVGAAKGIAETMLRAMLPALKDEIVLGWTPIWVRPLSISV